MFSINQVYVKKQQQKVFAPYNFLLRNSDGEKLHLKYPNMQLKAKTRTISNAVGKCFMYFLK